MATCDKCDKPIMFVATKRMNLIPIRRRHLCEYHKKQFERTEDLFLILALLISVGLFIGSMRYERHLEQMRLIEQTRLDQQRMVELDLNADGLISIFEEQATETQRKNARITGYPFIQVYLPDERPQSDIRRRLQVASFINGIEKKDDAGITILSRFPFPKMMKQFLLSHTSPDCNRCLHAIYLTKDGYLAFLLKPAATRNVEMICFEKIDNAMLRQILALP